MDESAIIINDFRLYQDDHSHIAIFQPRSTGAQRAGRIVQRLLEIESYRTIALLALSSARQLNSNLSVAERKLTELVSHIKTEKYSTDKTLEELLRLSANLEGMIAQHTYRFSASRI